MTRSEAADSTSEQAATDIGIDGTKAAKVTRALINSDERMTTTNETSTEARLGPCESWVYRWYEQAVERGNRLDAQAKNESLSFFREIDAEITTLTDALTEARAENKVAWDAYDALREAQDSALGRTISHTEETLQLRSAIFEAAVGFSAESKTSAWADRAQELSEAIDEYTEARLSEIAAAQSILKDAPEG